jgi:hypothetical protein
MSPLEKTLSTLTVRSGHELVGISTNALFQIAIPQVPLALVNVMGGAAAHVFDAIQAGLHLGWAAVKKAASRVTAWVLDHIARVLPKPMRGTMETAVDHVRQLMNASADRTIGLAAGTVLGLPQTRRNWGLASPNVRADAELQLPGVTAEELSLISKVGRVREFLDRYGRWLYGILAASPQIALALATLAVGAIVLVLSALWRGLRDVRELIS